MARAHSTHHVPERFLRQLWKHQHFNTARLVSTDGKTIEVLSVGTPNPDGGPDFLNARIRINGVVLRGDVELHQDLDAWIQHAHHLDPKYNRVILHVVLRSKPAASLPRTQSKRAVSVLVLEPYLTSSYHDLWGRMILDERSERLETIRCSPRNSNIESSIIRGWIKRLAVERMELKVRRLEERLKGLVEEKRKAVQEPPTQYDDIPFGLNPEDLPSPIPTFSPRDFTKIDLWEQLLYEGTMEALGYSKNQQPFRALARSVRLEVLLQLANAARREFAEAHTIIFEAILFGAAGLLLRIDGLLDEHGKQRAGHLNEIWSAVRRYYHGELGSAADWQFFRLRPENFPTIRLAGAARLIPKILTRDFFASIVKTIKDSSLHPREIGKALTECFVIPADGFWLEHYRFEEKAKAPVTKLIGKTRAEEIVINVVLPICLLYARIFKDKEMRQHTLKVFEESPPLAGNAVLRIMQKQLLKNKLDLGTAMLQQGTLQLYKFYCVDERCSECAVGKVVFKGG